ncbi:Rieske (2Fe-2S) protein [Mucilaginibacter terrae]|uniref:Nitrite reductase/ring-hydroxylating ferredoxin subunit n=1 Tax=Mucilaginibacter terrae TaxID=1955052 RepID=A0ABU3GQ85_9SPHI|nr:Rieske 2Fe-2S domain-containing protein [Mucilaginibacter terrae]MDT3401696.1 nitrite reductase/ring-hydroxylating ferredoxin subunit [Mucilaginibacter terrae]
MAWYKIAEPSDLSKPFLKKISAGGKSLCLVNADGELSVTAAKCPHAGADLSQGWCENGRLICPFHRYAYDLKTGRGAPGQNDYVRIYPVENRADGIYVQVKSWLEKLTGK